MAKTSKSAKSTATKPARKSTKTRAAASAKKTPKKSVAKKPAADAVAENDEVTVDRRRTDRRQEEIPVANERRKLERRAKTPRRRQIDPTTCERDYTDDELEFMGALDEYKRKNGRMFPTCSEVLEVIRSLGYRKHTEPKNADDSQQVTPGFYPLTVVDSPTMDNVNS